MYLASARFAGRVAGIGGLGAGGKGDTFLVGRRAFFSNSRLGCALLNPTDKFYPDARIAISGDR